MGKFVSGTCVLGISLGCLFLASCGSSSTTRVVNNEVPAAVSLTPGPNVSLELGKTQTFAASAINSAGTPVTETFSFQSSNPGVVTVANNGQACAGTWDSITTPTVCTPGPAGLAQITAEANGVISPAVNVYVHQHITNIVISKVPNQAPTLSTTCLTKSAPLLGPGPESTLFQAFAYAGTTDITATVGLFTWQTVAIPGQTTGSTSVSLSAVPANSPQCLKGIQGQCLNQEIATAAVPGSTEFFASAGGVNSQPLPFTTCPVQSIKIAPADGSSSTTFVVSSGTSTTLDATAVDILNLPLTGVPLTWNASDPVSVNVSGSPSSLYSSVGTVGSPAIGGGSVTASCTPPTCNGGIVPSLPIYSSQAFGFTVRSSTAPTSPTAYATTTACASTSQSCGTRIVSIARSSSTAAFSPGIATGLPFAPNSVRYDSQGLSAYLGVDGTAFGTQGIMVFNGSSVSQTTSAAGRVLAVSPDGSTVILSDTVDSPPRVLVCTGCNAASRGITAFLLSNAVGAAFSPDGLKAFIISGTSCPGTTSGGCLMIYSKADAPQFVQLTTPATDVAFIGNGTLGYIAGGNAAGASALATCDHPSPTGPLMPVTLTSELLRPLPDGQSALALAPPDVQTVTWPSPPPGNPPKGCVPPRGNLDISTSVVGPSVNLGVGSFAPTQFLISSDGTMAYILGQVQQSVNFPVTAASCAVNGSGTGCASPFTTFTYKWTSGPTVALGMNIAVSGMPAGDNGTSFPVVGVSGPDAAGVGTFTVPNSAGVPASGQSGNASGTETLKFDFILAYNIQNQTSSNISLVGSATPLGASLSPGGDLLFVGADDEQVHVINTTTQLDTGQVALNFPQGSSLCVGPGSPATSLQSLLTINSANQDSTGTLTTFGYSLTSGPPIAVGNAVKVTGMTDPGNNGTFVVTSAGMGSFTAVNPIGVTATSQNGSGSSGLACNPDLVVVKP